MTIWTEPPAALLDALRSRGLRRGFVVTDEGSGPRASDPLLEPLAAAIGDCDDYCGHEGCFFEVGEESGHLLTGFVHRTCRGQAMGGVRFWSYPTVGDLMTDGLRLSTAMGQKSALAGVWWGGGKGVIARLPGVDAGKPEVRSQVFRDYGRFLSGLCGLYVTGEDVGTTPEDMAAIFTTSRFATCIPREVGGSGNPSRLTAMGVAVAMEAALHHRGDGDVAGKTVALQGLGNVAGFLIGELLARGVGRIVGADIDERRIDELHRRYPGAPLTLRTAAPGDFRILAEPCDVLAPCAVGGSLNPDTIPAIQASIVCGAANNQLAQPTRDAAALARRNILYVPDFLANRMGLVNCSNEQYGVFDGDPAVLAHLERDNPAGVYQRTLEVLRRADESGTNPGVEAERLADELALVPHPVWPNRGRQIIDHLTTSGWAAARAKS